MVERKFLHPQEIPLKMCNIRNNISDNESENVFKKESDNQLVSSLSSSFDIKFDNLQETAGKIS